MNAADRSLVRARARAISQVLFLSVVVGIPAIAFGIDYPGKAALDFASLYIIAPLGLFSIVVALGAAFFRPEFLKNAIYAVIICAVLFFVINQGDKIFSALGQR